MSDEWTRENLAWLAGLFEGEGCIAHNGTARAAGGYYNTWYLRVVSTDEDVVRDLYRIGGCGKIRGPIAPRRGQTKATWEWGVYKQAHVYALLAAIHPWLHSRRRARAEECLRALSGRTVRTYKQRELDRVG